MKLIYNVKDKPKFGQVLVFAFQQLLAIMAATIVVPVIVGNGMSQTAALFGAGIGTLVYLLFTKFKSPVFLGSSFAFLGPMATAFAGAVSLAAGYVGLILGALMAGLVYVVIALVIKFVGVQWINKLMPPVVNGSTCQRKTDERNCGADNNRGHQLVLWVESAFAVKDGGRYAMKAVKRYINRKKGSRALRKIRCIKHLWLP